MGGTGPGSTPHGDGKNGKNCSGCTNCGNCTSNDISGQNVELPAIPAREAITLGVGGSIAKNLMNTTAYLDAYAYDVENFDARQHYGDIFHADDGSKPLLVWWGDGEDDASPTIIQKRALMIPGVGYLTSRYIVNDSEICTVVLGDVAYELVDARSGREEAGADETGDMRYRQRFCIANHITGQLHDVYLVQDGAGLQMEDVPLLPLQLSHVDNDPEKWLHSMVHYRGMKYNVESYDKSKDINGSERALPEGEARYDDGNSPFTVTFPGYHDVVVQKRLLGTGGVDGMAGYLLCDGGDASLLTVHQHEQMVPVSSSAPLVDFERVQHVENEEELSEIVVDIASQMTMFLDQTYQLRCGYLCRYLVDGAVTSGVLIRKDSGEFACIPANTMCGQPDTIITRPAALPSCITQCMIDGVDHQSTVLSDIRGLPLVYRGKNILAIKDVFPLPDDRGLFHVTINQVDPNDIAHDQRVVCTWSNDGVVRFSPLSTK